MNKHIVTHADGVTSERNSKTHIYTHAVVVGGDCGYVVRWAGSEKLAKRALSDEKKYTSAPLHIVEVTLLESTPEPSA
jgi:hypothetical protein